MPENRKRHGRYAVREADNGDIVIYDTANDEAWIRSDSATSIEGEV